MDQIREVMRFHHYAYRTEQTYVDWIVRFVKFHGTIHPRELGRADVEKFLSHLAVNEHVAAATQNQAVIPRNDVWGAQARPRRPARSVG